MTTFPDIEVVRLHGSFNLYVVSEECDVPGSGLYIPFGFVTDFASIPRFLWSILPPHGAAMPASVLHDAFYTLHPLAEFMKDYTPEKERLIADQLFRKNLIAAGISEFQAGIMYRAVRWFGEYRFNHYGKSRKTVRHERKIRKNREEKEI